MSAFECEQMVKQYTEWIRQGVAVRQADGVCVIRTPFLDRHHDYLQIYVERTGSDFLLSDDGYVLRDLRISGFEPTTELRREALDQAIRPYGVKLVGDELQIMATETDLPEKKHDLVQAMLAVGDLIYLAQPTVVAIFREDVERYLGAKGVRFVADVKLTGTSGFDHPFDFVIAASQKRPERPERPERYVRAVSTPNRENIVALMFSWQDVSSVRPPKARVYAILNDQEHDISPDHLTALDRYDIEAIRWTEREAKIAVLQD